MKDLKQISKLFIVGTHHLKDFESLDNFLNEYPVGGLALFNAPQDSPDNIWNDPDEGAEIFYEFIRKTQEKVRFHSVDQEGGRVRRLRGPFFPLPAAGKLSEAYHKNPRPDLLHQLFSCCAKQLTISNIHLNYAPVCDLRHPHSNNNVIGDRSFGESIDLALPLIKIFCEAFENEGVHTVLKHMPGHGSSASDSHEKVAVLSRSKEEIKLTDFKVFQASADFASAIMPAHISFPEDENKIFSLDQEYLDEFKSILPTRLRLISDDLMTMKAVSSLKPWLKCFDAGYDHILLCGSYDESAKAIEETIHHVEQLEMDFQAEQNLDMKICHAEESFYKETELQSFKDWKAQIQRLSSEAQQSLEQLGL